MSEDVTPTARKVATKATTKRSPRAGKADGETEVLASIAAMSETDRSLAERLHAIVTANAPALTPRLWYRMPAYAKQGKVVCFFQSAQKFKTRYATFGFQHAANWDPPGRENPRAADGSGGDSPAVLRQTPGVTGSSDVTPSSLTAEVHIVPSQ